MCQDIPTDTVLFSITIHAQHSTNCSHYCCYYAALSLQTPDDSSQSIRCIAEGNQYNDLHSR